MRSRLSVFAMVANAEDRFQHWVERVLEVADELVLCVDATSADGTLELARRYGDTVVEFEHPELNEHVLDHGARLATGDWILWLDDDELLHRDFPERIAPLLEDRSVTHYWQPCRWLVDDRGRLSWIRQFPWYPNPCLRLFRNLGGIFAHEGRAHSPFEVVGDGRVLEEDELAIWHTVFLIRDRVELQAKVARYRQTPGISCEEYYQLGDAGPVALEGCEAAAIIREATPAARAEAERRSQKWSASGREVPFVDGETLRRSYGRHRREADIFSAHYVDDDTPPTVPANQGASVRVSVRNTSDYEWRVSGAHTGRVVLSYHWEHEADGTLLRQGDVSLLPHNVAPGQEVTVAAGMWAPYEPGRYVLVWDLLAEDVNWFSERGVAPRRVPVEVAAAGRRLDRPRVVADLAPATAAPAGWAAKVRSARRWGEATLDAVRSRAELRAANVYPVTPERLYDSRNGTGVPGAVTGPLAGGQEVRLQVAGHHGVPDTAVGIVGTVCVLGADYHGFLVLRPAGTSAATVSAYFAPGDGEKASSVVVGLGRGADLGALSVVASGDEAGHFQLLLEVVAYLEAPAAIA